jgi:hypothetical protein
MNYVLLEWIALGVAIVGLWVSYRYFINNVNSKTPDLPVEDKVEPTASDIIPITEDITADVTTTTTTTKKPKTKKAVTKKNTVEAPAETEDPKPKPPRKPRMTVVK